MAEITKKRMLLQDIDLEKFFWGEINGKEWFCYKNGTLLIRIDPKSINKLRCDCLEGNTEVYNVLYSPITHLQTKI